MTIAEATVKLNVEVEGPLNTEQIARVAALTAAKAILTGTASVFGGTTNGRAGYELIEIADYIIGAPVVAPVIEDAKWAAATLTDAEHKAIADEHAADIAKLARVMAMPPQFIDIGGPFTLHAPGCDCDDAEAADLTPAGGTQSFDDFLRDALAARKKPQTRKQRRAAEKAAR